MNIFFWSLQIVLALHTTIGALWKFSNSPAAAIPSLRAIPQFIWIGLALIELVAVASLVLPAFKKSWGSCVPKAATFVAAEMILFSLLHLASGEPNKSPIIYWGVVAAICAFLAYGRWKLKPIQ